MGARRTGRLRARGMAVLTSVLATLALVGCSPEYDWRELRPQGQDIAVMLPAKPAQDTRDIDLDGLKVSMTMIGARAGSTIFALGFIRLPDATESTRQHALAAMRAQMVRNVAGHEQSAEEVGIAVLDADGRERSRVRGLRIRAKGQTRSQAVTLVASFFGEADRVWQAIALGPQPDPEQLTVFQESVRILR